MTAWYGQDPKLTLLDRKRPVQTVFTIICTTGRAHELEIFVADDEMNFEPYQTFDEIISIENGVDL